ncbi:MAG TPA: hypothetical protein VJT85_09200 [Gemmatimonadaceae bacterium]|nr:hypothetical protein [Gemmatimonadaceae bacterium]
MNDAIHDESRPDPAHDEAANAAAGRAGLLAQLRQLEEFAERTAADGGSLPPQASEMILHLREIVEALDGLAASMGDRRPPSDDAALARARGQEDDLRRATP